jgi:hypothetical protein
MTPPSMRKPHVVDTSTSRRSPRSTCSQQLASTFLASCQATLVCPSTWRLNHRGSARQLAERRSITLAFQTAAGGEVLLADADTCGGAVAHATMQERLGRPSRLGMPEVPADVGWLPLA